MKELISQMPLPINSWLFIFKFSNFQIFKFAYVNISLTLSKKLLSDFSGWGLKLGIDPFFQALIFFGRNLLRCPYIHVNKLIAFFI
jgi:hypothetical protein